MDVSNGYAQSCSRWAGEQREVSRSCATCPSEDSSSKSNSENIDDSTITVDVNAKELVQQHMKIAEEAIAGWEKAEAEAAELKKKLDEAVQEKLASEGQVCHLDGALKECMKQLRYVREDQEQKIYDAALQKTMEWEKIRNGLESSLNDARNELCEVLVEKQALSKSLQEHGKTITEISAIKSCLEADFSSLHARLVSVEKENAKLKSELHVVGKELELRSGEQEYAKKAQEAASKLSIERSKKIIKLEEECQRLKLLVKKRQPSPGPMLQRRGEADLLTNDRIRRCSPCRRSTTLPLKTVDLSGSNLFLDDDIKEKNKILSDQLLSMQEEAKSLRGLLAKRDNELKCSRLLCARTASKLFEAETHLNAQLPLRGSTKSLSATLPSQKPDDGSDDLSIESVSGKSGSEDIHAESWASALIAELAHIKADKTLAASDVTQTPSTIDFMDDFVEMEKFASSTAPGGGRNSKHEVKLQTSPTQNCLEGPEFRHKQELESTNDLCNESKDKLIAAKDPLFALQEKQSMSNSTTEQFHRIPPLKIDFEEGDGLMKAAGAEKLMVEEEKENFLKVTGRGILAKVECENQTAWDADFTTHIDSSCLGTPETEIFGIGAALAAALRKVLDIVESIGQTDYSFPYAEWVSTPAESDGLLEFSSPGKQWRSSGLDACVESLINLCNSLVQGKVDIIDFIAEVASALDWLVGLIFTVPEKTPARNDITHLIKQSSSVQVDTSNLEVLNAESSPTQLLCGASDVEDAKMMEQHDVPPDQSSVSNLSFQYSEASAPDEDARKSEEITSKVYLEPDTKASKYESEIVRLKVVNDQLEHSREQAMAKLADLGAQVIDAEKKIQELNSELQGSQNWAVSLEDQLQCLLKDKQSVDNLVAELEFTKSSLESELQTTRENIVALEMKVQYAKEELSNEVHCRKEAELQLLGLKDELKQYQANGAMLEQSHTSNLVKEEEARLKKEQELAAAAERLAECQQTILDLGKQLKALGVSKSILDVAPRSPSESPTLRCKSQFSAPEKALTPTDQACSVLNKSCKAMECNDDSVNISPSRNEKDCKQEQMGSVTRNVGSLSLDEPVTPAKRSGRAIAKVVRQAQFDVYSSHRSNKRFPSPTHEDRDDARANPASCHASMDTISNLPLRSPARFLSLRGKNTQESSKHGDNDSTEKHGSSGFSRFFARTKSGH